MEGVRLKVPDEESNEVCPNCGRKLVYKSGRFGRFLACPGYPDCTFTMPIVVEMPGKCPACGGRLLKRTSRNGYAYYACERGKDCPWRGTGADGREILGFMTWDVPTKDNCPECGNTMFKRSGRGRSKPFCINPDCPNYLPPEQRGYKPKKAASEDKDAQGEQAGEDKDGQAEAKKSTSAKKTTASKKTAAAKKTTAKKTAAEKKTTTRKKAASTEEAV